MITKKLANNIVKELKAQYKSTGVRIILNPREYFLDGDESQESSAYFDYVNKIVHVSTKDRDPQEWLINTLHETSHIDQMLERSPFWEASFINQLDVDTIAQLWIDGHIELEVYQRHRIFSAIAGLELDAERRTVDKIIRYKLDEYIDIKHYIKQAHAYATGYIVAGDPRVRKWIPANKPPYAIDKLVEQMPDEFTNMSLLRCVSQYQFYFAPLYSELIDNSLILLPIFKKLDHANQLYIQWNRLYPQPSLTLA